MRPFSDRQTSTKSKSQLKPLEYTWGPILFLMKLSGLYHYSADCRGWRNPWKVYSCLVCVHVLCMFVLYTYRSFPTIAGWNDHQARQFESLVDLLWYAVMLGDLGSLFLASHRPSRLGAFYHKWLELHLVPNICQAQAAIRKQTWFLTVFICVVVPLLCAAIAYYRTIEGHTVIFVLANFILEGVEMFSLAFYVLVFTTLSTLTSFANSQFLKFLQNPEQPPPASWETCRRTYVLVIELIDIADNFLCVPVGWCILCYVIQLTFFSFSYVLYFENDNSYLSRTINSAIWNLVLTSSLIFILWKGSAVHYEIHAAYPFLNKFKIGIFPLSMQNELIFLQYRLGNSSIGISVFKVHLITRIFASSIVSAYLTYLVILLQFKDSK